MALRNVIVIGSGPAGCTAAIYAARAGLEPLLVAGLLQGGQLTQSSGVENWPGAHHFPSGFELMESLLEHVRKFDVEILQDSVSTLTREDGVFSLHMAGGEVLTARSVIAATGSSARYLGIPGEDRFRGSGISACATCDGFFFRKKRVVVIGGGNTAVTDALYLAGLGAKTSLVHRRNEFRCEKILADKLMSAAGEGRISLHLSKVPLEFVGGESLEGVRIRDTVTGEESVLATDGVFEAVGHVPNTGYLEGLLELDRGYIPLAGDPEHATATAVPGLFAAGDVANARYQQAVVAAGSGCMAALDAEHYLSML